jgi:2-polyprenyl-3-methyl-5-hydroxy-6-metoxy-1,4-benzoquinol methylase
MLFMARDYNTESIDNDRKYAYGFDFDIMHAYMFKTFREHFKSGSILELGSFKGDFTIRLTEMFDDITCIEASQDAVSAAKRNTSLANVTFVKAMFENAVLNRKYDNILLAHVLEHVDDRIALLRKVREVWLEEDGIFIVACPNAYAPSRQIAVSMGLIEAPEAVMPSEKAHGHRVTYSMKTLQDDLLAAGLSVRFRSGVFFKALANFQWDRLMQTDIISEGYLDGCYELGKKYPDLCSTIFFVCEKHISAEGI